MSYHTLISAHELAAIAEDPATVTVDCRFSLADLEAGEAEYHQGHLPGAVYAHLDRDLSSPVTPTSGRHPLPSADALVAKFASWGIDHTKQIVAYDATCGAFASRLWWLARWLGVSKVAVLDGGLSAWTAAGQSLTTDMPQPHATQFSAAPESRLWLTTDQLAAKIAAGEVVLVDAREPERYRGEVEPIDPVAGHVPGAVNLPFKANWNADGEFLSADELRARFSPALREGSQLVHMCGSGVTACVNLLACEHAGLPGTQLYAGSWSEWIRNANRPISTGDE